MTNEIDENYQIVRLLYYNLKVSSVFEFTLFLIKKTNGLETIIIIYNIIKNYETY
ncbi:unnamed protein product [marine sediment metagenome]|uniref:Uncharacterized protein n=1 Tax=marine sediment metagenome TaxID=412755 RepID=X1CRL8_9ZZZZ